MKSKIVKFVEIITYFWGINFCLFVIFSLSIGGAAISGFIQDSTYYVAYGGEYNEVSKIIWYINYFQGKTLLYIGPIIPIYAAISLFDPKRYYE